MVPNVEIISNEMIKPSSPTPIHLKTLKLSFLDQIAPPIYIPLIFFYHSTNTHIQDISPLLKQSLSKILTTFYPIAGRIHHNSSIDCNDSGAEFVEARVHTRLSEVTHNANMEELKSLQPVEFFGEENAVLKVKVCFFDCGGISIAVSLSHKIADGTSLVAFVNAWAATCRGQTGIHRPSFDAASFFPQRSLPELTQRVGITEEKIATKRFVFTKEDLAEIIEKTRGGSAKNPSRVEAVSSHIWRRFIAAAGAKTASFAAVHAVNLRPRSSPPLSEHVFGNCWRPAIALSEAGDECPELAAKLRAAIRRIDGDFVRRVANGEYLEELRGSVEMFVKGGVELCNFSSWCRFPTYEVDYGWGRPEWVCTTTLPFKNVVILMSTPCGEGIEAWVNMLQDDMEVFEHQLIG